MNKYLNILLNQFAFILGDFQQILLDLGFVAFVFFAPQIEWLMRITTIIENKQNSISK